MKNTEKTRNYFIKEIDQIEFRSKKHEKVSTTLNYIEHFLILVSAVIGCVSISAFASLVGIPIGITSSTIGLKICAIIAGINTYKLIIKKKKKKHDKTVLLEKTDLNSIEVLISKALTDPNISHDEFVLVRNVFKEYDDMRKEIKKIKT